MTDAQVLLKIRDALRRGEQESVHLRGAWLAQAEEAFRKIPPVRRNTMPDLLAVGRCLDEAGKAHQSKDWPKMLAFIKSTHYAVDRLIGAD